MLEAFGVYPPEGAVPKLPHPKFPFIPRDELDVELSGETVIVGKKGAGKTASLGWLLGKVESGKVVIVNYSFDSSMLGQLLESVRGEEITLVWDDANPFLFREAIGRIKKAARSFRAIATSREPMPGYGQLELRDFSEAQRLEFAKGCAKHLSVRISDDDLRLLAKHSSYESTPFYIQSLLMGHSGKEIKRIDIETSPKSSTELWAEYARALSEEERKVMGAAKFLKYGRSPLTKEFLSAIYAQLYQEEMDEKVVDSLVAKGWMHGDGAGYEVHDAQLEAIDMPLAGIYDMKLEQNLHRLLLFNFGVAFLSENANEAKKCFAKLLQLRKEPSAYNLRAIAYIETREYDRALADLNASLKLRPSASAYTNRGVIKLSKGDQEAALEDFDASIKLEPDNPRAYLDRGLIHASRKDWESALNDFTSAIEFDPSPSAYTNRGLAYFNMCDYEEAIADFDQALRMEASAVTYNLRGLARLKNCDYKDAIDDFSRSLKIKPSASAYTNRGAAYLESGNYELALGDFNRSVELKADNPKAYMDRGLVYLARELFSDAIDDFSRSIDLEEDPDGYYHRALAFMGTKDYEAALDDLRRAIELDPKNALYHNMHGLANFEAGDYGEAIEDFNNAAELEPDNSIILHSRALAKFEMGDYPGAIQDFTKAIELAPMASSYNYRGLARTLSGQYDEAVRDFEQATKMDPDSASVYTNRSLAHLARDEFDLAIQYASKALELEPKNPKAKNVKGLALLYKEDNDRAFPELLGAGYLFLFGGRVENALECFTDAYYCKVSQNLKFEQREAGVALAGCLHMSELEGADRVIEEIWNDRDSLSFDFRVLCSLLKSIIENMSYFPEMQKGLSGEKLQTVTEIHNAFKNKEFSKRLERYIDQSKTEKQMGIWWLILSILKSRAKS